MKTAKLIVSATSALAAIAGTTLFAPEASAAVITVRSGQTVAFPGISPGAPGASDANVRCYIVNNPATHPVFNATHFAAANSGFPATVINPYFPPSIWASGLGALDPQARWINFEFMNNWYGYPGSALYDVPFFVPGSGTVSATMKLKLAVDDYLGDWAVTGANAAGVYINSTPLSPNYTAANYNTPTTYTKPVTLNGGTVNHLYLYQRDVGSLVSGIIFSADFDIANSSGCTPKPAGMTLWLPFDETSGTTSLNTVDALHPGTRINGPTTLLGQRVANSLAFDGVNDYVNVPTSPAYPGVDPGVGSFTIDAWLKKPSVESTIQVIVDHRQEFGGPVLGYSWFLGGSNNQAIQLGDAGGFVNWPAGPASAIPGDGLWHHAAVVVNRGPSVSSPTATFFVDGVAVGTPVNISAVPGNINPPAGTPFRVSSRSSSVSGHFKGGIDEVEFFPRALAASEVAAIFKAGVAGKCKNEVKSPVTNFCADRSIVNATQYICNYTNVPANYTWNMSTLGVGPGCTVSGPTAFSPASGSVLTVLPGQCVPVPVSIATPPGMPLGTTGCYQFSATNTASGETTSTTGKISRRCKFFPDGTDITLTSVTPKGITTSLFNDGPAPLDIHYQIRVKETDIDGDELPDVPGALRLNGLPPGEPVFGTLSVAPGTVGDIPLDVSFDAVDGSSLYTVIIEADTTGTGEFVALTSYYVAYGETTTCPCAADFDGSGGVPDAGDIDAFFNAWLAGDAPADVDCSGGTPDAGDIDVFFQQWLAGGC